MAREELEGIRIETADDDFKIRGTHNPDRQPLQTEREFARLLLDKTQLKITYEATRFSHVDEEGRKFVTVPDFRVVNPNTGVETFIELTNSINGKGKQKRVMQGAAPETHYVVFYRDKLNDIQNKFTDPITGKPNYALIPNGISIGEKSPK